MDSLISEMEQLLLCGREDCNIQDIIGNYKYHSNCQIISTILPVILVILDTLMFNIFVSTVIINFLTSIHFPLNKLVETHYHY